MLLLIICLAKLMSKQRELVGASSFLLYVLQFCFHVGILKEYSLRWYAPGQQVLEAVMFVQ